MQKSNTKLLLVIPMKITPLFHTQKNTQEDKLISISLPNTNFPTNPDTKDFKIKPCRHCCLFKNSSNT